MSLKYRSIPDGIPAWGISEEKDSNFSLQSVLHITLELTFGATRGSTILCHILCLLAGYLVCIVTSLWTEEVKNVGSIPDGSKVYSSALYSFYTHETAGALFTNTVHNEQMIRVKKKKCTALLITVNHQSLVEWILYHTKFYKRNLVYIA